MPEKTPKLLASLCIGDTFIAIEESAGGTACAQCPFNIHTTEQPAKRCLLPSPFCVVPDYLACHAGISFRIVETAHFKKNKKEKP